MKTGTQMSTTGGQHKFAQIPKAEIQRSVFDRSCGLKTTFDPGFLVPIFVDEALPGDTMQMNATAFGRIATLLRPIMDNVYLEVFFFAVPNRLLWDNWVKMNGEQVDPGDSTAYLVPQVSAPAVGGWPEQSLADYFGIPTKVNNVTSSALPFRAYNLIWNQWFRDENLQVGVNNFRTDGPDANTAYTLLRRGKRHDYFTSCLPFAQKGTAVTLPLGTTAPVRALLPDHTSSGTNEAMRVRFVGTNLYPVSTQLGVGAANGQVGAAAALAGTAAVYPSNLYADLGTATAATINQLREAFQIQRLFERDARGGTRYTEVIRSHFGVTSPDSRLQRSEYLGGGSITINVNPVANNAASDAVGNVQPLGELGGFGTFAKSGIGFRQSFTEHCTIIGLVNVRADLSYQQGLERMHSRRTRFDFYWPALAHLGEQAVLNREIYYQNNASDTLVFGYQERYAEYRYKPSLITGKFRSNTTGPLDVWHLAQNFTALPVLNSSFIQDQPPFTRVVAVPSEPIVLGDFFFSYKCARPLPVFGVPGLIDHF